MADGEPLTVGTGLNVKGDYVNTAPARYTLAVLSLAGLTVFPLTPFAAFSPEDAATIQTALAGKAVVEGALVPRGFAKVAEAKGDLDGDGTDDVALIVRRDAEKKGAKAPFAESDGVPQAVLIFTGKWMTRSSVMNSGAPADRSCRGPVR